MGGLNRLTDHKCVDLGEFTTDLQGNSPIVTPWVDFRQFDTATFFAKFPNWTLGDKCDLRIVQDVPGEGSEKEVFKVENFEPVAENDVAALEVRANNLDVQNGFTKCRLSVEWVSGAGEADTVSTVAVGGNSRRTPPVCPQDGTQYVFDWENLTPPTPPQPV